MQAAGTVEEGCDATPAGREFCGKCLHIPPPGQILPPEGKRWHGVSRIIYLSKGMRFADYRLTRPAHVLLSESSALRGVVGFVPGLRRLRLQNPPAARYVGSRDIINRPGGRRV